MSVSDDVEGTVSDLFNDDTYFSAFRISQFERYDALRSAGLQLGAKHPILVYLGVCGASSLFKMATPHCQISIPTLGKIMGKVVFEI